MYDQLFATAPDAMIVVDQNGRIVRANAQAERLFGYGEKELLDLPVEALMPEQARNRHEAHRAGYAANPRVRPMGSGQELIGQRRDGQQFPVEIALSPIEVPEGRLFVASVRDVSETQRARQALVRARYDACVAQIGQIALAAPNLDAAITSTPELVAAALGVDGVAILFRHPQLTRMQVRATHGIGHEVLEALPWPALLAGPGESMPSVPGFRSCTLVPLIDLDEPAGALLVVDRAARQFDRDAMHFLHSVANLLAAAMQRIRMEEQLSHAQRLEAVGQLTGGIAHDFNNLLTVISGNLQILEDELVDRPAAHATIGSALRAVGRGAELTRKLLAFARRQRLAPRACDPAKLLDELGTMLRRTLGEAVQLTIACPADIAQVFADPAQLDAALVNLALNARDAMPRGGQLAITAEERSVSEQEAGEDLKPGRYVVFSVRDTGLGMAPEILARAFEPFFTTKEHGKGSGLGLSMVYGFVKQSGGHVEVDSQLGYGTRADVYLPIAPATQARANDERSISVSRGSESILVVEDEADVREIATVFLRSLGYSVLAAPDAESALELLDTHADVALLFSDVVLGTGMSGAELAKLVQSQRPRLKVLLTSGYEHSSGHAADNFILLPKPYRREELAAAVRGVLDRS